MTYLAYQYGTSRSLRIRQEAHEHYSERPNDFFVWALDLLDLHPGQLVAMSAAGRARIMPGRGPAQLPQSASTPRTG